MSFSCLFHFEYFFFSFHFFHSCLESIFWNDCTTFSMKCSEQRNDLTYSLIRHRPNKVTVFLLSETHLSTWAYETFHEQHFMTRKRSGKGFNKICPDGRLDYSGCPWRRSISFEDIFPSSFFFYIQDSRDSESGNRGQAQVKTHYPVFGHPLSKPSLVTTTGNHSWREFEKTGQSKNPSQANISNVAKGNVKSELLKATAVIFQWKKKKQIADISRDAAFNQRNTRSFWRHKTCQVCRQVSMPWRGIESPATSV